MAPRTKTSRPKTKAKPNLAEALAGHKNRLASRPRAGKPIVKPGVILLPRQRSSASITEAKKEIFLNALAEVPNVSRACRIADLATKSAYTLRREDPGFMEEWDTALIEGAENLESSAMERALDGSDVLTIFLLKGLMPEKYRERMDMTSGGSPIQPKITEIIINLPTPQELPNEAEMVTLDSSQITVSLSESDKNMVDTALKQVDGIARDLVANLLDTGKEEQ